MSFSVEPNPRVTFGVLHQDDHVAVIEKPAGLVSTPGKGHRADSLLNGLFATYGTKMQQLGADRDFGMLQRLDRDASGVMVIALGVAAWETLRDAFGSRTIGKYYWAVTRRAPAQASGVIRKPLEERMVSRSDTWNEDPRRKRFDKVKLARVSSRGKPAMTAFRTLSANENGALLECRTFTGRLHQVRAHLDSIGCAILGDRYYGPETSRKAVGRLLLHAHRLTFDHPESAERADLRTRCPRDMRRTLRRLGLLVPGPFSGGEQRDGSGQNQRHQIGGDPVGEEQPLSGQ